MSLEEGHEETVGSYTVSLLYSGQKEKARTNVAFGFNKGDGYRGN